MSCSISQLIFCIGCSSDTSSYKGSSLIQLMLSQDIEIDKKQMVVILSGGFNPYKEQTIEFLEKISNDKKFREITITVIIPKSEKDVVKILKKNQLQIVIDEDFSLEKYGFHLSKSLFVELSKKNNVVYYNKMTTETIFNIKKRYAIL